MESGIVLLPINGSKDRRLFIFKNLQKTIDISYIGDDNVEYIGDDYNLKANILISSLINYMSLGKSFIFFNCENETPTQRKRIFELSKISKYSVIGLVIDKINKSNTMSVNAPLWSDGFKNIIYMDDTHAKN